MAGTSTQAPHNPDDKLFKAVFKRADLVREILASKAPKKVLELLALDTSSVDETPIRASVFIGEFAYYH